ncbi:hypothetical protein [Virgibacillus sp. DJP39]|uniref:hypothetical protein n=1 Tax=Virgibacillus sp. DJP39 TaxID=3409790 RepID=UPI003BB71CB1
MIKVTGETQLFFNSDKISVELIQRRLNDEFEKYNIIAHKISNQNHLLHIKFVMTMKKKNNSNLDYYSRRAKIEFQKKFPMIVEAHVFSIDEISYSYLEKKKPVQDVKDVMVTYINTPNNQS